VSWAQGQRLALIDALGCNQEPVAEQHRVEGPLAPWLRGKVGDRFGVSAVCLVDGFEVLAGHREVELHPGALVRAALGGQELRQ
jgi:hypothetical protein